MHCNNTVLVKPSRITHRHTPWMICNHIWKVALQNASGNPQLRSISRETKVSTVYISIAAQNLCKQFGGAHKQTTAQLGCIITYPMYTMCSSINFAVVLNTNITGRFAKNLICIYKLIRWFRICSNNGFYSPNYILWMARVSNIQEITDEY